MYHARAMTQDFPDSPPPPAADLGYAGATPVAGGNLPELSVSDLSRALKRTVEETFGYVRVRGEVSQPKRVSSGHLYLRLKDDQAVIEAVCWKGTVMRLAVKPEDGMEVVCTGRLTTYPGRSQYQLIIETMELAGEGALLKMLEERKRRLAAEGLFDAQRKRPLPFLPRVIGVVTSPTGAVIRDILHRLADRFPRHVLLWPVAVQGEQAAAQVARAIQGFNAIAPGGPVPRPDLLIVARGGGSLEDLMPFNEEIVVRAAAASQIPLISAVGHETDTTLIDFASDRRAPTPTAAAEMAVPVRAELMAQVMECGRRLEGTANRLLAERRNRVEGLARGLGDPRALLEGCAQRLDDRGERLALSMTGLIRRHRTEVAKLGAGLRHPAQVLGLAYARLDIAGRGLSGGLTRLLADRATRAQNLAQRLTPQPLVRRAEEGGARLDDLGRRLDASFSRAVADGARRLEGQAKLLETLSYRGVLARGFALVTTADGHPVTKAADAPAGGRVRVEFIDGAVGATLDGEGAPAPVPTPAPPRESAPTPKPRAAARPGGQGSLF
ncbi:exodeoxyribonuclease VII large subunit [Nitrospirillum viridazoti]|uniref:Exodeoxyribonuclease 7 large subunit n=3 Tax=Nitrospirillum TaxID=1543705 RepID=A0A560ISZ3_9PROT|nr:exodeoxyribonuclease VII large subunit [Nitrospirillum amazonense]